MRIVSPGFLIAVCLLVVGCASAPPADPNEKPTTPQYVQVYAINQSTQAKTLLSDGASYGVPFVAQPGDRLFSASTAAVTSTASAITAETFDFNVSGRSFVLEKGIDYPLTHRTQINGRHVTLIRVPSQEIMGRSEAYLTVNSDGSLAGHLLVGDSERLGGKLLLFAGFKPPSERLTVKSVPATRSLGLVDYVFESELEAPSPGDGVLVHVYGYKADGSRFLLQKLEAGGGRLAPCGSGCRLVYMKTKAGHVFVVQGAF